MKFVGRGKCDEEIIVKATAYDLYRNDYGISLRVAVEEINGESVVVMDKKVNAAAKKYFGEKVDVSMDKVLAFIKLKPKNVYTLNGKKLYDDEDGKPAPKGGVPYSELCNNSFDTIKGQLMAYSFKKEDGEQMKGVAFIASEFYAD